MTIGDLREAKYRSPFRPFRIRMAGGSEIRAPRAEHIAWDEGTQTVVCRSGGGWDVIDVDQIASVGETGSDRQRQVSWSHVEGGWR